MRFRPVSFPKSTEAACPGFGPWPIQESSMFRIIALGWTAALTVCLLAAELPAQEPTQDGPIDFESVIASARAGGARRGPPSPFRDFNEVTKGADKVEGLFTLYTFKTGEHLYGEI